MAQANFIKHSQAINDGFILNVYPISYNEKIPSQATVTSEQKNVNQVNYREDQPMESSKFAHPSTPVQRGGAREMTRVGQSPHLQRHSRWTNKKRPPNRAEDPLLEELDDNVVDGVVPELYLVGDDGDEILPRPLQWTDKAEETRLNQPEATFPTQSKDDSKKAMNSNNNGPKNKTKSSSTKGLWPPPSSPPPPIRPVFPVPTQFSGTPRFRGGLPYPSSTPFLSEEVMKKREFDEFYKTYDPKEGIVTAIVLGGFFVFVSLLVLYKTKCKPMWKNRRKRLTNTPVTQSVVEGDSFGGGGSQGFPFPSGIEGAPVIVEDDDPDCGGEDEFGFECIPLHPVCNDDDDDDDDIYFLDEFGNYVFPLSTPTIPGSCSCPSTEDLASAARRVSQVSNMSNAYTVKSLPGAYIYIPVTESNIQSVSSSMPSVKRTLSDPEIHFTNPLGGHPVILTVKPTSEISGNLKGSSYQCSNARKKLQQRSFSVQPEVTTCSGGGAIPTVSTIRGRSASEVTAATDDTTPTAATIDINVIQATPNLSPSCSLRSFSVDPQPPSAEAILTAIANDSTLQQPSNCSITTTTIRLGGKVQRRVSFSEDEVGGTAEATSSNSNSNIEWPKPGQAQTRAKMNIRQNTLPGTMSYLQVPGQQALTLMAPALSPEALAAQTSAQARKRRTTRLMKAGSFCSITSEGDGDIFGNGADHETIEVTIDINNRSEVIIGETITRETDKKALDPMLSEYSEFYDNDKSDISDLFEKHPRSCLKGQRTLSDECGSIRSLSMDLDEAVPPGPSLNKQMSKGKSVDDDEDTYASSSCSISIESDGESGRGHQITVPVTIEPPPPEMRGLANSRKDPDKSNIVEDYNEYDISHRSPKTIPKAHNSDSTEEIRRASPGGHQSLEFQAKPLEEYTDSLPVLEPGMRMVLVRDIGVQVSGDSPNLNLTRRAHKRHPASQQQHSHPVAPKKDSLTEKFPAEILF